MTRPLRLSVMVPVAAALSACSSGSFSPTAEEKTSCAQAILKHGGVGVLGDEFGYNVRSVNTDRTVQINYPPTEKRPGFSCSLHNGELAEIIRIERIYPASGTEL